MPPNKEQRERLQGWLDLGKKLRDQGPDLVERVPSPSTIFEGYCNGTLIPHFHVGIRSSALAKNPQQFCVSLQAGRKRERFVGESGFGARHPKITVSGYTHTDVPGVLGEDRLDLWNHERATCLKSGLSANGRQAELANRSRQRPRRAGAARPDLPNLRPVRSPHWRGRTEPRRRHR